MVYQSNDQPQAFLHIKGLGVYFSFPLSSVVASKCVPPGQRQGYKEQGNGTGKTKGIPRVMGKGPQMTAVPQAWRAAGPRGHHRKLPL